MQATGAFLGGVECAGMDDVSLLRVDDGVQIVNVEAVGLRESNVGHVVSRLLALAREEGGRLVVSLALVEDMTSAGVGALVSVTETIAGTGGKLVLVGLQPELDVILRSTGLSKRLNIAGDISEALKLVRRNKGLFGRFSRAA
ncbi:MAG: STAS domain-containing protein [Planctomycetota bacterium]